MAELQARQVAGDDDLAQPGDYCFAGADFLNGHAQHDPKEYRSLLFNCPACGTYHGVPIDPHGNPGWKWDGNVEKPTLSPSIQILGHFTKAAGEIDCRWHGFLRNGVWIDA